MEKQSQFVSFEKLSDWTLWVWIITMGSIIKFLKWFAGREVAAFWDKVDAKIDGNHVELDNKIDKNYQLIKSEITDLNKIKSMLKDADLKVNLDRVRDYKHDIDNRGAAIEGTLMLVLDKLKDIENEK